MVKKILIVVGILVVLIIIVGFMQPHTTTLSRQKLIKGQPEEVFAEVNDLRQWPAWSWWMKNDPTMKITFGEPTTGLNASYAWTSDDGNGSLSIIESDPGKSLKTAIHFTDFGTAYGTYTFAPAGDSTRVTMEFSFENGMNPLIRLMSAFMIKPEVDAAFEYELSTLKTIIEGKPAATPSK
ncbi:Polyketide cyclase / dehydrase and lipid transport [Chryseolinea serpens]|uniref:Polyketide cyclase / dehydrase and lipid transport n=1 Tax=Chryseolinea serpens TaxID=947013 RepID=A0A1M5WZI0_9BACT|nr:SRPBCC family protein [Chryseolinea serpens]SHH93029.1 Polyketide cyclase / dehydrase and lipid transport [Chryseolinea serpens]